MQCSNIRKLVAAGVIHTIQGFSGCIVLRVLHFAVAGSTASKFGAAAVKPE